MSLLLSFFPSQQRTDVRLSEMLEVLQSTLHMYTPTHMQRYVYNGLKRSNISGGCALKAKPTQTLDALRNAFLSRRSAGAHAMYLIITQCNLWFSAVCANNFQEYQIGSDKNDAQMSHTSNITQSSFRKIQSLLFMWLFSICNGFI